MFNLLFRRRNQSSKNTYQKKKRRRRKSIPISHPGKCHIIQETSTRDTKFTVVMRAHYQRKSMLKDLVELAAMSVTSSRSLMSSSTKP